MSEFRDIEALLGRTGSGRAVLVTLVRVDGTSYRKPGAKMVVTGDGDGAGAISGGCLENLLRAHALESLDRDAHVVMLDTTSDSDLLFGHGLGCPGKLRFLIEPFPVASLPRSLVARQKSRMDRERIVVVSPLPDDQDLSLVTARADANDRTDEQADVMSAIARDADQTGIVRFHDHSYFVEIIEPPVRLMLIGAGLDVPPFTRVAESCGFEATQILRTTPPGEIPDGPRGVLIAPPENIAALKIDSRTAVVVMTHNYLIDLEYLRALLHLAPFYIGVIGARRRFQKIVADLKAEGFSEDSLLKLHGPAGLDIGAETPAQIALSVAAEVQAVAAGKPVALDSARSVSRQ